MQAIGLCRFSYPAIGGFQVEHDSLEERIAYLYAPERLEERFRFMECFTLPCIRAQTDPDFTFLILIGDSLPKDHRARLEALIADIPQAQIISRPPERHRPLMREVINSVREQTGEPCLQFRLDDDDAVAMDYIARLREAAGQAHGLLRGNKHIAIDFNQGYIARPDAQGLMIEPIQRPYWTAGLAIMLEPNIRQTIMNFGHMKMPRVMPTVTFTGQDMMLRGHNDYNDSRQGPEASQHRLKRADVALEARIHATYNIDANHVRRVFSDV